MNEAVVARGPELIDARQYVLSEYSAWALGLTEGATDETTARHGFVYGDFHRVHSMGIIACHYRAAEWGHKEIELAANDDVAERDGTPSGDACQVGVGVGRALAEEPPRMSMLGRLMGKVRGPAKQAERGGRDTGGTTDRNVGGRQADTPVPPELPLDDDGNNARNIGG